jgi:hypothetical protein
VVALAEVANHVTRALASKTQGVQPVAIDRISPSTPANAEAEKLEADGNAIRDELTVD